MLSLVKNLTLYKNIDPKDFPECVECGACCTYFRVYFKEENNPDYKKLGDKIYFISKEQIYMRGREKFNGNKCVALGGEIGKQVACSVYENRPDVCRKYDRVLENGKINPRCAQAREAYGLNPYGY